MAEVGSQLAIPELLASTSSFLFVVPLLLAAVGCSGDREKVREQKV